jgi:flavin reductase (DIM6/NTAB) family NADH-FMN oxidoreductase RutF
MKKSIGAKTLAMPAPVWIIGSYDAAGIPNVMAASWGGICCSKPPALTVSLRKATYSYDCIIARKAFTVSIPSEAHVREADFFGIASGREVDKFAATGLTAAPSKVVDAPYVEEFPLILECRLLHYFELGLHTQFVGEIIDTKANEDILGEKELPDLRKVKPFVFNPATREYYRTGEFLAQAFSVGNDLKF